MPRRWGIRFAVQGDLRFLSHHDMMRLVERTALRAELPLHYSQGFNPRPAISLVVPRPVGVASRCDLMVVGLDGPADEQALLEAFNAHAPEGVRALSARPLETKAAPQPRRISYELLLDEDHLPRVRRRLDELKGESSWPLERRRPAKRPGRPPESRQIDLRPLVADVRLEGPALRLELQPSGNLWARPGEVLRLLGLDEQVDLAAAVRTGLELDD